jgi:hypothetical protein
MKVTIPDQLKSDVPQTKFGKILAATPVVMAVVATMLAGLASSEMTRAQYDRSLGAQQQAKAGDQWGFFQAKRLRGAFQRNTAELLQAVSDVHPLELATLQPLAASQPKLGELLGSQLGRDTIGYLQRGETPPPKPAPPLESNLKSALDSLEDLKPDAEMARLLAPVTNEQLETALRSARDQSQAFDDTTKPINQVVDQLDALVSGASPAATGAAATPATSIKRDFTAARLRYTAARYEVEARLNQAIASLYELQVRKSNFSAEHHHARSQKFFFGMLGAQLGVIVATFAMAARNRNFLWSLAAAAGLLAIAFAIYVYLYV